MLSRFRSQMCLSLTVVTLLAGCSESDSLVTRDDVIDIADDAIDASDVSSRLEELEERVAELEQSAEQDDRTIQLLLDTGQSGLDREEGLDRRLAAVEDRLGM